MKCLLFLQQKRSGMEGILEEIVEERQRGEESRCWAAGWWSMNNRSPVADTFRINPARIFPCQSHACYSPSISIPMIFTPLTLFRRESVSREPIIARGSL